MPSRRSHTKSRHGCARCKVKRVKCDEARPVCGSCLKHGAACEFGDVTAVKKMSLSHIISSQASTSVSTPPSTAASSPAFVLPEQTRSVTSAPLRQTEPNYVLNMRDLELLHNFVQEVVPSLSDTAAVRDAWNGPCMREAFGHSFLMHGILGVSALHLALSTQTTAGDAIYKDVALRQERAMELYRPELNNITEDNCHALFLFSTIVSLNAFAFPRLPGPPKPPATVMEDLIDVLRFVKSITILLGFTNEWVARGPLVPLLRADLQVDSAHPLCTKLYEQCKELDRCNEDSNDPDSVKTTNAAGIEALRNAYRMHRGVTAIPFLWPSLIGNDFHELLEQRQPMSLTVLAHYAIMMSLADDKWWSKGWSRVALTAISQVINPEWLPAIAFPMEELGMHAPEGSPGKTPKTPMSMPKA